MKNKEYSKFRLVQIFSNLFRQESLEERLDQEIKAKNLLFVKVPFSSQLYASTVWKEEYERSFQACKNSLEAYKKANHQLMEYIKSFGSKNK